MTTRRRLLIGSLAFGALIASATSAQAQNWTIIDYRPAHSTSVTLNHSPEVWRTAPPTNNPTPTQPPSATPVATQTTTPTEEERQVVIQQVGTQELAYTGAEEWLTLSTGLALAGSGLLIISSNSLYCGKSKKKNSKVICDH